MVSLLNEGIIKGVITKFDMLLFCFFSRQRWLISVWMRIISSLEPENRRLAEEEDGILMRNHQVF